MVYKIEEDLQNERIKVIVEVRKKSGSDERIVVRVSHIDEYVKNNFKCPPGYINNGCISGKGDKIDNTRNDKLHCEWVYHIAPLPRTSPKYPPYAPKSTKKTAKKPSTQKKSTAKKRNK
jgi:hypothetical protein